MSYADTAMQTSPDHVRGDISPYFGSLDSSRWKLRLIEFLRAPFVDVDERVRTRQRS